MVAALCLCKSIGEISINDCEFFSLGADFPEGKFQYLGSSFLHSDKNRANKVQQNQYRVKVQGRQTYESTIMKT